MEDVQYGELFKQSVTPTCKGSAIIDRIKGQLEQVEDDLGEIQPARSIFGARVNVLCALDHARAVMRGLNDLLDSLPEGSES